MLLYICDTMFILFAFFSYLFVCSFVRFFENSHIDRKSNLFRKNEKWVKKVRPQQTIVSTFHFLSLIFNWCPVLVETVVYILLHTWILWVYIYFFLFQTHPLVGFPKSLANKSANKLREKKRKWCWNVWNQRMRVARDAVALTASTRCPTHWRKTSLKTSCIDNARCKMMKMVENLRQNFSSGGNQCIVLCVRPREHVRKKVLREKERRWNIFEQ